jgi:AcrR family transcriptional regulator
VARSATRSHSAPPAPPHDQRAGIAAVSKPETSRYDRRLREILRHATEVFCEKGFAAASIRDISRASGTSLAGLYYYFDSKEHLLFLVQQEAFSALLQGLEDKLEGISDSQQAIEIFISNHLQHFVANRKQAQVLSHESDTLMGPYKTEIATLKRQYYRRCLEIVEQLRDERRLYGMNSRLAVLSLFGMMNWIYTWYNPAVDGDWKEMAHQMTSIFLTGTLGGFPVSRADRNGIL